MKWFSVIFFFLSLNLCYSQSDRFHFKAEAEWGYLMKGEKYFSSADIPSSASLKLGVETRIGKNISMGLLLNTTYLQSILNSGESLRFPTNPPSPKPGANEAYYVLSNKAVLFGPSAFISYLINDKLNVEFQFSYMKFGFITDNNEYFYFINDKRKESTSRLTDIKLTSHTILQFSLPYQVYKGNRIALSLRPFYSFHIINGRIQM